MIQIKLISELKNDPENDSGKNAHVNKLKNSIKKGDTINNKLLEFFTKRNSLNISFNASAIGCKRP